MKKAMAILLCLFFVVMPLAGCSQVKRAVSNLLDRVIGEKTAAPGSASATGPISSEPGSESTATSTPTPVAYKNISGSRCISAGYDFTLGLRTDGTVVAAGKNEDGQCNVSGWTDVIAVAAGSYHSVGLRSDGTVVAAGSNLWSQCDVGAWRGIVLVSAGRDHTVALGADGKVFAAGNNEYKQCDVSGWSDIVSVAAGYGYTVGLKSDGTVVATGNNDVGQCDVSGWSGVIAIDAGDGVTYGVTKDGAVLATDDYYAGITGSWTNIVSVDGGFVYAVGLTSDGNVVADGSNTHGQCNVSGWQDITAISANFTHTVGLKSDGTVVATGENAYGQIDVQDWSNIGFPKGLAPLPSAAPPTNTPAQSTAEAPSATETPQPSSKTGEHVLTITKVTFKDPSTLGPVEAEDENGKTVTLSEDYGEWFEGGTFVTANMDKGSTLTITADGMELGDDTVLKVVVQVGGTKYSFLLGVGSKFSYTMADGEIRLVIDNQFTSVD